MSIVHTIARSVHALLTTHADEAAKASNVILRQRKFTPQSLAATFILGFLKHPHASHEQLAQMAAANGIDVTPQAIEQRFHSRMVPFLRTLFERSVQECVQSHDHFGPLLDRFTDVHILDSTILALPDDMAEEFPGCGGSHRGAAAMKLQVRLSLKTGAIDTVAIEAGRDPDGKTPLQRHVPATGSLRLADLGYFDGKAFDLMDEVHAYWISPWMNGVVLHDGESQRVTLIDWLETHGPVFDGPIRWGVEKRRCRMIAWRLPPEVAKRRRTKILEHAKQKGQKPSAARLERCDWAILLTNLPREKLSIDEARVLYRSRWQIELLFKRWKSQGGISELTGRTVVHCMVQLWSRLLAAIVQQWMHCGVWGKSEISLKKVWDRVSEWSNLLAGVWQDVETVSRQVERILATLDRAARQNKRKSSSCFEMLSDPRKIPHKVETPTAA